MKIIAITQARTGSSRLPNKVLKEINGETLLKVHIDRIKQSQMVSGIMVATTISENDYLIKEEALKLNVDVFRGSEDDVLDRFYQSVKDNKPDFIVRLTSDCPLVDGKLIDSIIRVAIEKNLDYCSNTLEETYPDGQDIEVVKFSALEKAWKEANLKSEREHVTPFIKKNSTFNSNSIFSSHNVHSGNDEYNSVRMTVDEEIDFVVISKLIEELGVDKDWKSYADYYLHNSQINSLNGTIVRNEGYLKSLKED